MTQSKPFASLGVEDYLRQAPRSEQEENPDLRIEREALVQRIVQRHPDGIGTSDVHKLLATVGFQATENTVRSMLVELERSREVYSTRVGAKGNMVWFPNGKIVHDYLKLDRELRDKVYRFSLQEGRSGPRVQIQERAYSLLHGEKVDGAIFIDFASLSSFLEALEELRRRYEELGDKIGR